MDFFLTFANPDLRINICGLFLKMCRKYLFANVVLKIKKKFISIKKFPFFQNYEQNFQYHHHPTLPVTRSSSIARTDGNNSTNNNNSFPQTTFNNLLDNSNTGSLPRLNICNNKNNNYEDGRQQHNFQQVGGVTGGSVGRLVEFFKFF